MARLAKRPTPDPSGGEDAASEPTSDAAIAHRGSLSPSPAVSFSSDKENHMSRPRGEKASASARLVTPNSSSATNALPANKRRRLDSLGVLEPSEVALRREKASVEDKRYYDPEQPMSERRAVRKGIRDLARGLAVSHNEYLAPDSTGLVDTITKANDIFINVKQPSEATLDARLLVTAGDLTARRTVQNKLGGVSSGIDVDGFVTKCMSFMRKGPGGRDDPTTGASGRRRQRRLAAGDVDSGAEEVGDPGDAFNWEWLGVRASYPTNLRPPVPGFLLGPLSIQRRVRKHTQRTQRQARRDPADATRPDELKAHDIERVENANLTTLCTRIYRLLYQTWSDGVANCKAEVEAQGGEDQLSEEQISRILEKHSMADNEGVCLFRFAFNPRSFGQTIENLFYISFLIRDGKTGLGTDSNGLCTLHITEPRKAEQIKKDGVVKHQAVFHVDFENWQQLIEAFDIKASIIPHRESAHDDNRRGAAAKGWYG